MKIALPARCAALALLALCAAASAAPDPGPPSAPAPAPSPAVGPIWRMDAASKYSDPTGIILHESLKFRGTWSMTRVPLNTPSAANQLWQIGQINWLIAPNIGEEFYVSGWGEYRTTPSVGMLAVIGHRMTVNVKWGSETNLRRFDSGVIAMSNSQAGRTVDIVMHEVLPTDAGWPNPAIDQSRPSLRVRAAALPRSAVKPYITTRGASEFLNGCYDPCDCPISLRHMDGKFGVVELPGPATSARQAGNEWALVEMRFTLPSPATTPRDNANRTFAGAGILQYFPRMGATIAPRQRLRAAIFDSLPTFAAQPEWFDSGVVARTVALPLIDIAVADNDFHCFNRVLHIVARPAPVRAIGVPAPEPIPMPYPGPGHPEER